MNVGEALDKLAMMGLQVDHLEADGQLHRVSVEGKKSSNRAGAYCLRELNLRSGRLAIVGFAQNWVTGQLESFTVQQGDTADKEEWEQVKKQQAELRKQAKQEAEQRAKDAAERAQSIFEKLPDSGKGPYLFKKGVRGFGLRYSRDSVVVPVRDIDGDLKGLQFIDADGGKKFLTGTAKRGCFHFIGDLVTVNDRIGIAEGYATAASIYQITGIPTAVAFDAGNLLPVAQAFRHRFPDIEIVIFGDDDRETEGNPGRTKALAAAQAVNGRAVFPQLQEAE
jgi:putative DNA primase/helicase